MKNEAYSQVLNYLRLQNRGVSPHELSLTLQKSRVTVQSALKRLAKNGWVRKTGNPPKVYYSAVNLTLNPEMQDMAPDWDDLGAPAFLDFISWCKSHKYHIPERVEEYKNYLINKK